MCDFSVENAASKSSLLIRRYQPSDHQAVRNLFLRVNRDLAPAGMHEAFEAYIKISLREEIDKIPEYYDEARGYGFWILADGAALLGNFGLERVGRSASEIRRMSTLRIADVASQGSCFSMPRRSDGSKARPKSC